MCPNSNESAGEPKSMVFVWVPLRKIMKLRVSYETFAKKSAGAPGPRIRGAAADHAQTHFYRQNLSSVDKSGPGFRGRQREPEAPEEEEEEKDGRCS